MNKTPEHRAGFAARSGDPLVIDQGNGPAGKAAKARDPLDHDGDGRKGGMKGAAPQRSPIEDN